MRKGIYTDLDSLFDIRAVLACLIDKNNEEFIKSGKYKSRIKDNMGNVSSLIFKEFYRRRTKQLFRMAMQTPLLKDIIRLDYIEMMSLENEQNTGKIPVFVNIHPYNFSIRELDYLKYTILKSLTGSDVRFISMNYEELNPKWIHKHIRDMYMYNGLEWLNYQAATFKIIQEPLLDVMLVVPTLLDSMFYTQSIKKDAFVMLEDQLSKLIEVHFIKTSFFCGVPTDRDNAG